MKNLVKLFGIIALAAVIGFSFMACGDEGDPSSPSGSGLSADIDSALAGTSWKDNTNGTTMTLSFTSSDITWGGSVGSSLNTATAAYNGSGYDFVWIAKDGNISYKYSYNGATAVTVPVYGYEISGNNLLLKSNGTTFVTLVPSN